MVWGIVQAVKDRYSTTPGGVPSRPKQTKTAAQLYECPDCGSVYIADELDSCAACETSVNGIPNEQDLGITSRNL